MENGETERKTGDIRRLFTDRLTNSIKYQERANWLFHFPQAPAAAKKLLFWRESLKFQSNN